MSSRYLVSMRNTCAPPQLLIQASSLQVAVMQAAPPPCPGTRPACPARPTGSCSSAQAPGFLEAEGFAGIPPEPATSRENLHPCPLPPNPPLFRPGIRGSLLNSDTPAPCPQPPAHSPQGGGDQHRDSKTSRRTAEGSLDTSGVLTGSQKTESFSQLCELRAPAVWRCKSPSMSALGESRAEGPGGGGFRACPPCWGPRMQRGEG